MTSFDGFPMASPAVAFNLWAQIVRLGIESQMVIAMRLAGMAGLWPTTAKEQTRMVTEKHDAAWDSFHAMGRAFSNGASPEKVMAAALQPYSRRAHANARRLSRAGMR